MVVLVGTTVVTAAAAVVVVVVALIEIAAEPQRCTHKHTHKIR